MPANFTSIYETIVQNIDDCEIKFEYELNKSEMYGTRSQHVPLKLGIDYLLSIHAF